MPSLCAVSYRWNSSRRTTTSTTVLALLRRSPTSSRSCESSPVPLLSQLVLGASPLIAGSSQLAWRHTGLRHSASGKRFVVFEHDEHNFYINPTMKHAGTHRAPLRVDVCLAGACQSLPRTAAHEQFAPWLEHHLWYLRGWQQHGDPGDGGSDTSCQQSTRIWSTFSAGLPPSLLSPLLFLVNRMCIYFPLVHNESWPFHRLYTWLSRDHNVIGGGSAHPLNLTIAPFQVTRAPPLVQAPSMRAES